MKKKWYRRLLLAMTLCLLLGACTQGTATSEGSAVPSATAQSGSQPTDTPTPVAEAFTYPMQPTTLTINLAALDRTKIPDYVPEGAYIWDMIAEETGVTLEHIGAATNAYDVTEEFLLLLASMDYPDIFFNNWISFPGGPAAAVNDGYITLLDDYTEYFPALMQRMDENPEMRKMVTNDAGNLFCFPYIREEWEGKPISVLGPVVRADWLDQLGLPVPVTLDDWYIALKAFKEEMNASAPLTFESRWLFIEYAASSLSDSFGSMYPFYIGADGKIKFGPLTDEYKAFITEMAKWYSEGLIDLDMPSIDKATVQAKFANGEAGITLQQFANVEACEAANADNEAYKIAPLTSPVKTAGDKPKFSQYYPFFDGSFSASISTQSENIEAVCRYLDWFYTEEGSMLITYGKEGVAYTMVNGEPVFTDLIMNNPVDVPRAARSQLTNNVNWPQIVTGNTADFSELTKGLIRTWGAEMPLYAMPAVTHTDDEAAVVAAKWGDIDTFCRESILRFITGTEDIGNYDKFREQLKGQDIEGVLAAKQAAYERYMQR